MRIFIAGFNLFQQWSTRDLVVKNFTEIKAEINESVNCEVLLLGWSYNLFKTNRKNIYLSGLYAGKKREFCEIPLPSEVLSLDNVAIAGTDRHLLLLDKANQKFWKSSFSTGFSESSPLQWIQIPPFSNVMSSISTHSDKFTDGIMTIKASCTMNLCLSMDGQIYDIPQRINTEHCVGKVINFDCGNEHAIVLTDAGNVYTWGSGRRCQLGHGDLRNVEEPVLVEALAGVKIVTVRAGGWHSCALSESGDLYVWGWNQSGQLGLDKPQQSISDPSTKSTKYSVNVATSAAVPMLVDLYESETSEFPLESVIADVACGSKHTALLLGDYSVWTTGSNTYCQLGLNSEVPFLKHFTKVWCNSSKCSLLCGPWSTVIIS